MKTLLILPALIACLCAGVQAQPVASKAVDVTAMVLNTCKFDNGTTGGLALGNLDPSSITSADPIKTSLDVTYRCTKGFAPTITVVRSSDSTLIDGINGTAVTLAHANETITATIKTSPSTSPTGLGFGAGNTLTLSLTAEVQPSALQDARGGAYLGSLTIQLNP